MPDADEAEALAAVLGELGVPGWLSFTIDGDPNSGDGWDARQRAWTGARQFDAGLARRWAEAGASVIGGCCRVRPSDIAGIAMALRCPSPPG